MYCAALRLETKYTFTSSLNLNKPDCAGGWNIQLRARKCAWAFSLQLCLSIYSNKWLSCWHLDRYLIIKQPNSKPQRVGFWYTCFFYLLSQVRFLSESSCCALLFSSEMFLSTLCFTNTLVFISASSSCWTDQVVLKLFNNATDQDLSANLCL